MAEAAEIQRGSGLADWWRRTRSNAGKMLEVIAPLLPSNDQVRQSRTRVNGFDVCCDQTLPTDPTFMQRWTHLFERMPTATAFQHPAWQCALMESAQALRRLRLFTVYAGPQLIAVAPLEVRFNESLRSVGPALSDYLNPLIDPNYTDAAWAALIGGVAELEAGRTLALENIDPAALPPLASAQTHHESVSRIALPATWDGYLAALAGHDRKELRRKMKKAEEAGATFTTCNDPETIFDRLQPVFALMEGSGGGKARKAKWVFPRHFSSAAAPLAKAGRLELCTLSVEGNVAAAIITLPTQRGPILWNTAFDPAYRALSPGIVLFGSIIRRAIEQGHASIDLLRGSYDYKQRLGAVDHPLVSIRIETSAAPLHQAA